LLGGWLGQWLAGWVGVVGGWWNLGKSANPASNPAPSQQCTHRPGLPAAVVLGGMTSGLMKWLMPPEDMARACTLASLPSLGHADGVRCGECLWSATVMPGKNRAHTSTLAK
jgi:hypothetical protein